MGKNLVQLPKTKFSGLDYNHIVEDIENLIRENPEYNQYLEDFVDSNGARVLIELFAWITDQLASRIDMVVNENFPSTATQKSSIIKLLKTVGYKFELPKTSHADVNLEFSIVLDEDDRFTLARYSTSSNTYETVKISVKNRNNRNVIYEAVVYDEINNKFEYYNNPLIVIPSESRTVRFFEGETKIYDVTVENDNNPIFEIPDNNICFGSVRVYLQDSEGSLSELEQVDTFLAPRAQKLYDEKGDIIPLPYVMNILSDNKVSIELGPTSLLPSIERRVSQGSRIKIFYRTTQGLDGEINARAINTEKNMVIDFTNTGQSRTRIKFLNPSRSSGAEKGEEPSEAILKAPLHIRAVNKTVTEEDYNIILGNNPDVLTSSSYGYGNLPPGIFTKYGEYMGSHEVWNFIVPDTQGWRDLKTYEYNDFRWFEYRLEKYVNEPANFIDGLFNYFISRDSSPIIPSTLELEDFSLSYYNSSTISFKNYVVLNFNDEVKEKMDGEGSLANNENFRLKMTNRRDSATYFAQLDSHIKDSVTEIDFLQLREKSGSNNYLQLSKDIHAFLNSTRSIPTNGLSFLSGGRRFIRMGFDDIGGDVIVDFAISLSDLTNGELTQATPGIKTIDEIISTINYTVSNYEKYKYHRFGLNFINPMENQTGLKDERLDGPLKDVFSNLIEYRFYVTIGGNQHEQNFTPTHDNVTYSFEELLEDLNSIGAPYNVEYEFFYNDYYVPIDIIAKSIDGSNITLSDNTSVDVSQRFFRNFKNNIDVTQDEVNRITGNINELVADEIEGTLFSQPSNTAYSYKRRFPNQRFGFITQNDTLSLENFKEAKPYIAQTGVITYNFNILTKKNDETDFTKTTVNFSVNFDVESQKTIESMVNFINNTLDSQKFELIIDERVKDLRLIYREEGAKEVKIEDLTAAENPVGEFRLFLNLYAQVNNDGSMNEATGGNLKSGETNLVTTPTNINLDYSNVASQFVRGDANYIRLESPKSGSESRINFEVYSENKNNPDRNVVARDTTEPLLGINYLRLVDVEEDIECLGKQKITLIWNDNEADYHKSIIYENGSITYDMSDILNFYFHYIAEEKETYVLGKYFYDNFEEGHPRHKPIADRIFSTSYNPQGLVDLANSDFRLKFTIERTTRPTIYSIENSIDLKMVDFPKIKSINLGVSENVEVSGIVFEDKDTLSISIDGTEDINIVLQPGSMVFNVVNAINAGIRGFFQGLANTEEEAELVEFFENRDFFESAGNAWLVYKDFEYAKAEKILNAETGLYETRIIIQSPTYDRAAHLRFNISTNTRDCSDLFFEGVSVLTMEQKDIGSNQEEELNFPYSERDYITIIASGDYYISHNKDYELLTPEGESTGEILDLMEINKTNISNIPDSQFYIHYVWDRRKETLDVDEEGVPEDERVRLDEDVYRDYLNQFKITGIENVFKSTRFTTFDVVAKIYYNSMFSLEYLQEKISNVLYTEYSLENQQHRNSIFKSKVLNLIHQSEPSAISHIELTYFGKNYPENNEENSITADFDEILILSDPIFANGVQTHGLIFTYEAI